MTSRRRTTPKGVASSPSLQHVLQLLAYVREPNPNGTPLPEDIRRGIRDALEDLAATLRPPDEVGRPRRDAGVGLIRARIAHELKIVHGIHLAKAAAVIALELTGGDATDEASCKAVIDERTRNEDDNRFLWMRFSPMLDDAIRRAAEDWHKQRAKVAKNLR